MMDRRELAVALRAAQVPDTSYAIAGIHDIPVETESYFFLRPDRAGWVVGRSERSVEIDKRRFATEDKACRHLHDLLMTVAHSDAAQQIDELLARRERMQREAWEAFQRARRQRDRRDEPPPRNGGI
jgi:hypothetical protein